MTKSDFPLNSLEDFFTELREELENGLGVIRIKGLPVRSFLPEEQRLVFWGLGLHLGTPVPQSIAGEMIGEVRDETRDNPEIGNEIAAHRSKSNNTLGILSSRSRARSNGPLRFHSDGSDLISLLCVRNGLAGGESKVVSTAFLYNEIRRQRPDLHALLCKPYHRFLPNTDRAEGDIVTYAMPIFGVHNGKLSCQYCRTFVEQAQELDYIPGLTGAQTDALDLLAELAERHCIKAPFDEGDIQLINNHVVFHGRTPFEDAVEGGQQRLLLRLWLTPERNRALPKSFGVFWGSTEAGQPRSSIDLQQNTIMA
ncbi:MAG: hypothetical protein CMM47_10635 [Rhodospirillaceae bacterium]|nr:hypothetical protein [Rhodospirillaceae bacterium]|tara:strand:- start:127 stop:1059 length:933 start_codon:yes stop_codon:yes gene_type:complete